MNRVAVIGLDALDAEWVDAWWAELPNLRQVAEAGIHGPLRSIVQPVTPVAWTAAISGRNPGHFGFTDFRYRPSGGYGPFKLVHSGAVPVPTLYRWLPEAGLRALMVGVPVAYPPVAVEGGVCVSCFMTPTLESGVVHPPELQPELLAATSTPFLLDVTVDDPLETVDLDELRARLLELDRQRFDLALHLARTRDWDLLFLVCMGTDRVGHYFVRYADPEHPNHIADATHEDAILAHYRECDRLVGRLLDELGPDTTVLVVSDHGMQRREGTVHVNQWLVDHGYLVLTQAPEPGPLDPAAVDWRRTRAWARGYGGQVFLNVRGRDPEGTVDPSEAETLYDELVAGLRMLRRPDGSALSVAAFPGGELFDGPLAGRCPDLCVQFDGLRFLASERLGVHGHVRALDPDSPDQGSHAADGFLALAGPGVPPLGRFESMHLLDVAATIRDLLGLPELELDGRAVHRAFEAPTHDPFTRDDERELTRRLAKLYLE